jgi:NAD(P)-dependent dehydrogenase (short-subunit alcohol dehydrogenase family)
MDLELQGQRALVTASSGGIGEAIATTLAAEGARVIVNGRTEATVEKAVERIRAAVPESELEPLVADRGVGSPEQLWSTIEGGNANWKGLWKGVDGGIRTYDNIQYVLRFMVDCKVRATWLPQHHLTLTN